MANSPCGTVRRPRYNSRPQWREKVALVIVLIVIAAGCLVYCWFWGDLRLRTKLAMTLLYAASWATLLIPFHGLWLFPLSQAAAIIAIGGATFGVEWLLRD